MLNERLRKRVRDGVIEREVFAEAPPRVEDQLTEFDRRFDAVLEQIAALESERDG